MKEKEKIDIVLRGLYEYRNTKFFVYPKTILPSLTATEDGRISSFLHDGGLAIRPGNGGYRLKITAKGVMYCEGDSQTFPGEPVITITQVINSPGATVITMKGQVVYPNSENIMREIESIKHDLHAMQNLSETMIPLLDEFLDDIHSRIEDRKKIPLLSWEWLNRSDTTVSIAERLKNLHDLIYG